ncbi:hypothetical protein DESC_350073 [Desulfosarcina cetonica]|nr:hypothetical protein DESC_350073 [Desulfosarcina cetonica]
MSFTFNEKNSEWVTKELDYCTEKGDKFYNLFLRDGTNFVSCSESVVDRLSRAIRYFKIESKGQLLNSKRSVVSVFRNGGYFKL